ncbi:MAG: hypothetical protein ACI4OZ_02095, partial [Akkermansia sp.]
MRGGGSKLGPWPYFPWVAEPRHQSETSADSDSAGSDTPQYTVPLAPGGSSAPVVAASAPAPVVIASAPAASAPSASGSGAVSCGGGGAACGGGAGGSSGGGSASASPAPAAPAAPEEPSADPSQPSDPTDSEDEDTEDKPDSTDPGSEDASLTLPEDSAATLAAASVPARARLFSLPVKMLGATAATYAASEESGVSATAATDTPTTWEYGWNSVNKCVTLNSEDVEYHSEAVTLSTLKGTYSIEPDSDAGYSNQVFMINQRPS